MSVPRDPPPLDPDLERSYYGADFVVFGPEEVLLRVGRPLPPQIGTILEVAGVSQAIIVTACNPFSQRLSTSHNEALMAGLEIALAKLGLRWLPAEGRDPDGEWPAEPSVFLLGPTEQQIDGLMVALEQYTVVRVRADSPPTLVFHPMLRRLSSHWPDE